MNTLFLCVFVECSYFKIKWSDILKDLVRLLGIQITGFYLQRFGISRSQVKLGICISKITLGNANI